MMCIINSMLAELLKNILHTKQFLIFRRLPPLSYTFYKWTPDNPPIPTPNPTLSNPLTGIPLEPKIKNAKSKDEEREWGRAERGNKGGGARGRLTPHNNPILPHNIKLKIKFIIFRKFSIV